MRAAAPVLLALLLACAPPLQGVRAWGAPGHMVTASLAERHLSAGAAASAASDLQVFKSLYPTESEFVTAADWRVSRGSVTLLSAPALTPPSAARLRPDFIKASTTAFSQWHYIDLPYAPAGDGGAPPVCSEAQNVVWALENAAAVLRSAKSDAWSRSTMLRFLIHFMGDLHQARGCRRQALLPATRARSEPSCALRPAPQPLHAASLYTAAAFPKGDEGGNSLKARCGARRSTLRGAESRRRRASQLSPGVSVGADESASELHAFWDNGCGHSGLESVPRRDGVVDRKAVDALAAQLDGADVAAVAATPLASTSDVSAAFKAWAAESHAFARNTSYAPALLADLADGREAHTKAPYWAQYEAQASAVARQRLRLGGARLAQVLNSLHHAAASAAALTPLPPRDAATQ